MIELSRAWVLYFYGSQDTYHKATYISCGLGGCWLGMGRGGRFSDPALLGPKVLEIMTRVFDSLCAFSVRVRCHAGYAVHILTNQKNVSYIFRI